MMKTIEIFDIRIGDVVRWESAAGTIRGEVTKITMGPTAAGDYVPWYTIKSLDDVVSHICGRGSYLKMMKFEVIFRDPIRTFENGEDNEEYDGQPTELEEYDGQPDELTEWMDFNPDC